MLYTVRVYRVAFKTKEYNLTPVTLKLGQTTQSQHTHYQHVMYSLTVHTISKISHKFKTADIYNTCII